MIKEYCDRCKGEINPGNKAKEVRIALPSDSGYENEARITLCEKCLEEMELHRKVINVGYIKRKEKDPTAVEKLLDVIGELVEDYLDKREA